MLKITAIGNLTNDVDPENERDHRQALRHPAYRLGPPL